MQPSGCATQCERASSLMAKSTPDQYEMFSPRTSTASPNATSSQASADGPTPPGWPDGPSSGNYGQALAHVSRSVLRGKEAAPPTSGIYGPTFFGSSVPEGPLSSWESRLRERLAMVGSTECALIWREKTSPGGRSISRLSRSTPLTSATASIGSPETTDPAAIWPTPTVASATGGQTSRSGDRADEPLLGGLMRGASPWSTPRASDGEKGAPAQQFSGGGQPLPAQMYGTALAPWATPKAAAAGPDFAKSDRSSTGLSLQTQMALNAEKAPWVTPSARDWKDSAGMATEREDGRSRLDQLPRQMAATSGAMPDGSSATTGKRGVPNPAHPCWLMGYEAAFLFVAPQDCPKPRSKAKASDG